MALLTVIVDKNANRVTAVPASTNYQLAKASIVESKTLVSTFIGTTATSITVTAISDTDFAKLYIGAPITGSGVAASSKVATMTAISGANQITLNNATTTSVANNTLTQTVTQVITTTTPPQQMIVSDTVATIDGFSS